MPNRSTALTLVEMKPRFSLTSEQQEVVDCDAPATIVTASAGTGKTEILARRIERFLSEPENGYAHILAITYTTRAAAELRHRLQERLGDLTSRVACDTIHGFANSMLRQHGSHVGLGPGFQVITTDDDRVTLLREFGYMIDQPIDRELLRGLDRARAMGISHQDLQHWRFILASANAVDFAEMLTKAIDLAQIPAIVRLYQRIYGLVIVDEAQNITQQQYTFLKNLTYHTNGGLRTGPQVLLMGDPKQSIIGFAGADPSLLDEFKTDYGAKHFTLSQNFRSSLSLARLARRVEMALRGNESQSHHSLEYPAPGLIQVEASRDEWAEGNYAARWVGNLLDRGLPSEALATGEEGRVKPEEIAVLARNSSALRLTANALRESGRPVALAYKDTEFMATDLGTVSVLLLRRKSSSHNMTATMGLRRALRNTSLDVDSSSELADGLRAHEADYLDTLIPLLDAPSLGSFVGQIQDCDLPENADDLLLAGWLADRALIVDTWKEYADKTRPSDISWQQFAFQLDLSQRSRDLGPGVRLLTVHKAQGREFKAVAIVGMNDGQFPDFRVRSERSRTAELKTFYVAITRASRVLLLSRALKRDTRFGPRPTEPSPYLNYLQQHDGTTRRMPAAIR